MQNNPDHHDPRYNTKYGIYKPHCGLDNVFMNYGHDEYIYQVCTGNKCRLPPEGLVRRVVIVTSDLSHGHTM